MFKDLLNVDAGLSEDRGRNRVAIALLLTVRGLKAPAPV